MQKQKIIRELRKIMAETNDFIIMEFNAKANYYIQFSIKNETQISAEAVSNYYLEDSYRLKPLQIQKIKDFKWTQDSQTDNFCREFTISSDEDYEKIADMVIFIIEEAYQCQDYTIEFKS
jgi:predicted transcriptional regulator